MGNKEERCIIELKITNENQITNSYKCDTKELLETLINRFAQDIQVTYSSPFVLYNGESISGKELKTPLSEIIKPHDQPEHCHAVGKEAGEIGPPGIHAAVSGVRQMAVTADHDQTAEDPRQLHRRVSFLFRHSKLLPCRLEPFYHGAGGMTIRTPAKEMS